MIVIYYVIPTLPCACCGEEVRTLDDEEGAEVICDGCDELRVALLWIDCLDDEATT